MSTNVYSLFKDLLKEPKLYIGKITIIANGEASVALPNGGVVRARGIGAVGDTVFVRNRVIEGPAPNLPVVTVEV